MLDARIDAGDEIVPLQETETGTPGGVDEVHVYSNVVTITLARGHGPAGIREIIEGLYTYYREGVTPAIP